ncbi:MAG: N-formylglutamate amidohydrolase [Pseudomonadota bacterium]
MSILEVLGPEAADTPLVLDSPHSGSAYPADFVTAVPMEQVRRAEDFDVHALFGTAPALGVPLLHALFPRIYVDVNRTEADIDPASITGALPFAPAPSAKAALGKGVIWMEAPPPPARTPLYEAPLPAAAAVARLSAYWQPYRARLSALLHAVRARHGRAFYLDCHSMQSVSTAMHEEGAGLPRPEIVLGDRDGTTCAPNFTRLVAEALTAAGFEVAVNAPYKGADLVVAHGRPSEGFHALQIEVRRDLYMDEVSVTRSARFDDTRDRLGLALKTIRDGV